MSLRDDTYDPEYPVLEKGDVAYISNPGNGLTDNNRGLYCVIEEYNPTGYYGSAGYRMSKYEHDLVAHNYEKDWVGVRTFGENPLVLFNINEEAATNEDKQVVESALDKQVSGTHYKGCKIQPIEYIHANGLDYFQGNVVKYVTRHKDKNGKADIEKAIHYLELILELQYGE